jgi:AmmeMemoRadiSam system protein A
VLSEDEKRLLLKLALDAINASVKKHPMPDYTTKSGNLLMPRGAFVTIYRHGDLRGCIGYVQPHRPLVETVIDAAIKAASEDFRFNPLTEEELMEIDVEISVLSPLTRIEDFRNIRIGIHGIMIEQGSYRGLLLPQVAAEHGWDAGTFLSQTCRKAGLMPDAWKHPQTRVSVFTAEVIGEHSRFLSHSRLS